MEVKFLEALLFDAYIDAETIISKSEVIRSVIPPVDDAPVKNGSGAARIKTRPTNASSST